MKQHAGFSLLEVLISLFLVASFTTCFINHQAQQTGLISDLRHIFFGQYQEWNRTEHV